PMLGRILAVAMVIADLNPGELAKPLQASGWGIGSARMAACAHLQRPPYSIAEAFSYEDSPDLVHRRRAEHDVTLPPGACRRLGRQGRHGRRPRRGQTRRSQDG